MADVAQPMFPEAAYFPQLRHLSVSFAFELRTAAPRAALRLRQLHRDLQTEHPGTFAALVRPVRSYLDDVTVGDPGTSGRPLLFAASAAPAEDASRAVWLHRQPQWTYEYEDCETILVTPPDRQSAKFMLRDSFCAFESGRLFYLLTMTLAHEDGAAMDEYGVLQLQQLAMDPAKADDPNFLSFSQDGDPAKGSTLRGLAARRLTQLAQGSGCNGISHVINKLELLRSGQKPNGLKDQEPVWSEEVLAKPGAVAADGRVTASPVGMCIAISDKGMLQLAKYTDAYFEGGEKAPTAPRVEDRHDDLRGKWVSRWAEAGSPPDSSGGAHPPHSAESDLPDRGMLVIAGIAQGVPDFPSQDQSEVHDASRPASRSIDSRLYVHPHFIVDIGDNWRSFHKGRPAAGTCPYLLLMWAVAMHDELLVTEMEEQLDSFILGHKEERVVPLSQIDEATLLSQYLRQRLELFRWVELHRSGTLFRYPRERGALAAIQRELGTDERFARAEKTAAQLEAIIEDAAALTSSRAERKTNRILIVIALLSVVSVFSVAHDVSEHVDPRWREWAFGALAVLAIIALVGMAIFAWTQGTFSSDDRETSPSRTP